VAPSSPKPLDIIPPEGGGHRGGKRGRREEHAAAGGEPAKPGPGDEGMGDKEFESAFAPGSGGGGASTAKGRSGGGKSESSGVYIPPEPGRGSAKEELADSDIMEVVLNNKPGILKCVSEQKSQDPSSSGSLVMHWSINTNGRTSGVAVASQSADLKNTPIAKCITGLVRGWKFPQHKVQHAPVDFPFKF
jgi:hypothetical protein